MVRRTTWRGYNFGRKTTRLLAVLLALTVFSALRAEEPYGFRANGQGRFPDATPVTEWGPELNVVWKTPMPGWSNASPVICGDRLFVCSEPTMLVCVNLADGKILWQKSNDYLDLLTDPTERSKAKEQMKRGDELKAQLDLKMRELNDAKAVQDAPLAGPQGVLEDEGEDFGHSVLAFFITQAVKQGMGAAGQLRQIGLKPMVSRGQGLSLA